MNMLKMCLNWKVLAALAAVGAGIYLWAPNLLAAALPLLILAVCPLSMVLMMGMMTGGGKKDEGKDAGRDAATPAREGEPAPVGAVRHSTAMSEPRSAEALRRELDSLRARQTALADQLEAASREDRHAQP